MARAAAELLGGPDPPVAPARAESAPSARPRRAFQGLPARSMRARELPLVLLALVLCQASPGPAAPVPAGGGTVLDKMYPRGNHWAVGECPARSGLRRDRPAAGDPSPHLSVSGPVRAQAWGLGLLRPLYPNPKPLSQNSTPPFVGKPSVS